MMHRYVFERVFRTLCDIMKSDNPFIFGGKIVLLGKTLDKFYQLSAMAHKQMWYSAAFNIYFCEPMGVNYIWQ